MYLLLDENNNILIDSPYPFADYPEGNTVVEVDSVPADTEELANEWSYIDGEFVRHEPFDTSLVKGQEPMSPIEVLAAMFAASPETMDALPDEALARMAPYMPEWSARVSYQVGDKVSYLQVPYRCLTAHAAQEAWNPADAPSLWARILIPDPETIPEWVQPESTNPYMKGDKVTHNGKTWVSDIDGNVWEPGVYGWTEVA